MIYDEVRKKVYLAACQVEGEGIIEQEIYLEHPDLEVNGDYSTNAALILKGGKKMAEEIAGKIKEDNFIQKVFVAGPGFINIWLQNDLLGNQINEVIRQGDGYGRGHDDPRIWLIEHTSPNPNKAMHLGHLRNNVTGMAIANIWEFSGRKVIRDGVDNDRGIAIAKLMWGYKKFADGKSPDELGVRPDRFVDELYARASAEFEKSEEVQKEVRQMVVDWEAENKKMWDLWKQVLEYSYRGQEMTLERLGNRWDRVWHEHEHYKKGKEMVEEGLEKGIFKKVENGTIVTDLTRYHLPDTVVMKSDGTALYITQDLALTKLKEETFHPDRMFWCIGPEQTLALQQLFAVCEQLGIGNREDYTHVAYGYMSIKGQGKMGSRTGNVIYIDDLLDQVVGRIKEKITSVGLDNAEIAEKVGVGAVKYSVLKVGRLQDMAFDLDESISLQGNSGPYLQYTYARTQSVLNKSKASGLKPQPRYNIEYNDAEVSLLRYLYRFPEVVGLAAERQAPNLVCNYLFELTSRYNSFYNQHSILTADKKDVIIFRINLTAAVGQVIKNGLGLLGIEAPERM